MSFITNTTCKHNYFNRTNNGGIDAGIGMCP